MWRVLFLFSVIPVVIAMAARWWFGLRILAQEGGRSCRCDLETWMPAANDNTVVHKAEETANEFGRQLRLKAIAEWSELDPKGAAARGNTRRFGMAVPPLSGIIAIFAILVGKVPVMGAIAILLAATAFACALGLLSLAPELKAIHSAIRKVRSAKCFPRRDDEEAIIRCAIAHAWKETFPPIISMVQR